MWGWEGFGGGDVGPMGGRDTGGGLRYGADGGLRHGAERKGRWDVVSWGPSGCPPELVPLFSQDTPTSLPSILVSFKSLLSPYFSPSQPEQVGIAPSIPNWPLRAPELSPQDFGGCGGHHSGFSGSFFQAQLW